MQDQLHVCSEKWHKYEDQTAREEKIPNVPRGEPAPYSTKIMYKKKWQDWGGGGKREFRREVNYFTSLPF
jgi:hypothetical protein